MTWEYRRWADGRVEIIRRRSFLKLGLWSAASLLAVAGLGYVGYRSLDLESSGATPAAQSKASKQLVLTGDREAAWHVVARYHQLDARGRLELWRTVAHLKMLEILPFAQLQLEKEQDPRVRRAVEKIVERFEEERRDR